VRLPGSSKRTDEDIAADAVRALQSNLLIPSDRIKVTVRDGWVTLEGDVEWQYQRDEAERAVRNLTGVVGVSDLITIRPRLSPSDVKAKIEEALERNAEMDARRIDEAERATWAAPGVRRVENNLAVAP
jgi:osmotically-inducible protein OsmY